MKKHRKDRKSLYFIKQKIVGLVAIVLSILMVLLVKDESVIMLFFMIPLGLAMIFSRDPIWMQDDYFWENLDSKKAKGS